MELTGTGFSFPWEVSLMEWLQTHIGSAGIGVISFLSAFGEQLLMVAILGFLYWSFDKKMGRYVGLNLLMACVWNPMIKNIFLRRRPYFDHEGIKILRVVEPDADIYDIAAQGYSFPSGHSATAAAVYGSLGAYTKKKPLIVLAFLLPLLVGFSRVVVGAHYPTDVLAGWAIGGLVLLLIPLLSARIKNRLLLYGILLVLTLPGLFYCRSNDYFTSAGMLIGFITGVEAEEKYVRFENTRNPLRMILRVAGGGALYFALNVLLKLPFSAAFLESGVYGALLVRLVRYAVIMFVLLAVYPILFRYTAKIGLRKN